MPLDHYRQAEAFMTQASRLTATGHSLDEDLAVLFNQRAQIQATLALVDAIRALADQQVQVDIEDDGTFQLRGIAVRRSGGVA